MAASGSQAIPEIEAPAEAAPTEAPSQVSDLGEGKFRVIWDTGSTQALVQFYRKGDGVVLDYIRVRQGGHNLGGTLFADALRAAGIPHPLFVESSPIINPTLSKLVQSGTDADLTLAQRFWHIQALAFAKAIGASVKHAELRKNRLGNWVATGELSY